MQAARYFVLLIGLLLAAGPAAAAERVAVKGSVANVRAAPSTKADTLWQIEQYHPLLVVEKRDAWYRFKDFEGDEGWIHSSLVDKSNTVIVSVRWANIRSGPDTEHALVFDADRGTPFKVLLKEGSWLKIEHADGDVGWILDSLVW